MKNLHLLPTANKAVCYSYPNNELVIPRNPNCINQNIYITSDEEIKEGDWRITKWDDILKVGKPEKSYEPTGKKIILTDNQDLIKDGVQAINDEFLEWFVKNSSCRFVETIKTEFDANFLKPSGKYSKYYVGKEESIIGLPSLVEKINYKIIIPKEEPFKHEFKVLTTEEVMKGRSSAYEIIDFSEQEIENQIKETEQRGEKVVKYLEMFKGQSIYNDIALAIEFGYQLKLNENDKRRI